MTKATPLELMGAPGSPYTRKMVAALRYRRIPYAVYWGTDSVPPGYPEPKPRLLPTFFFPDGPNGALQAVTDSSPIIRRLEEEHPGRSIIPTDPALAFINDLIEDYGDEWLTKAMFHFRWAFDADARNAAPLLAFWRDHTENAEQAGRMADAFAKRQIDRLYVVGSNDITAQTIENSYTRLLQILDTLLQHKGFVLGARPSSADFALYGQMTQLAVVEPTSAAITSKTSQRVRAWIDLMEDLSGLSPNDDDWFTLEEALAALRPLLSEIGRVYTPFLLANAKAVMSGADSFDAEIDGRPWTQPTFKYQAKCLGWLRDSYGALSPNARQQVDTLLQDTGCEPLFN